jgi:hypothetical protein
MMHSSRCSAVALAAITAFVFAAVSEAYVCASLPLLCGDLAPPPAFDATFVTTAGNFTVMHPSSFLPSPPPPPPTLRPPPSSLAFPSPQIHSELVWAPVGSARFYLLCRLGYYSAVQCV